MQKWMFTAMALVAMNTYAKPICHSKATAEMENTEVCRYADTTLAQAYRQYRENNLKHLDEDAKHYALLAVIPPKMVTTHPDEQTSFQYAPRKNGLDIEQQFAGGVTTISFRQRGKDTQVTTVMSAD